MNNIKQVIKGTKAGTTMILDKAIIFHVEDLVKESYANMEYVGETIEKIAKNELERYKYNIKYTKFFAYLMREIMRNVVEHSHSKKLELYLFSNEYGDFGFKVKDTGIGIKKSLESNPNYLLNDNITALAFAIRPGITRSYKKDPSRSEEWQNSGFGLYMVSNLISRINGRFEIATGNVRLVLKNNYPEYVQNTTTKYKRSGTEVICVFNTRQKINTSRLIMEVSKEGNEYTQGKERFAEYSTIKTASKASTLIE